MPVRVEQNHLSSRHLNTIHSDKGKEHLRDLLPVFKLLHLPVGDYLDQVEVGRPFLTVGSTIPWAGVLV